jgi:hypothetical protein
MEETTSPTRAGETTRPLPYRLRQHRLTSSVGGFVAFVIAAAAGVVLLVLLLATPAHAESPWWHLTSGARPGHLRAGVGKPGEPGEPEIQEITVGLEEGDGGFELGAGSIPTGERCFKASRCFVYPESFANELGPEYHPLTKANLEATLETVYGAGNFTVSEPHVVGEVLSFEVAHPVGNPITVNEIEGLRKPSVKIVSPGTPGKPATHDGEIYVTAENIGDAELVATSKNKVQIKDILPAGLKAVGVAGSKPFKEADFTQREPIACTLEERAGVQTAVCTLEEGLAAYDQLEMRIAVEVQPGATPRTETSHATIGGGNAAPASLESKLTVSDEPVPFGVESYEMDLEEEGGTAVAQAGAHPFQLNATLDLNQTADINPLTSSKPEVAVPGLAKDLAFNLPPGLIGNPSPIALCTITEFFEVVRGKENRCPADSAVGVAVATVQEPSQLGVLTVTEPVFNIEPQAGEPARFGFAVEQANSPVLIDTSVRTGSDYGVTVHVNNITQTAAFLSSEVTFWGVPGDPRHDNQRGWACLFDSRGFHENSTPCTPSSNQHPPPFLSLPTRCETALNTTLQGDSWQAPGDFFDFTGAFEPAAPLTGCNRLQFAPEVQVKPDGQEASEPTGLTVDVHVAQEVNNNAAGLASSNVKDISVTFPKGVALNPSAADGLQACSEEQVGLLGGLGGQGELLFTPTLPQAFCPDASKVGTVTIKSPLLPKGQNVEGALYLATPAPSHEPGKNPFNTLVAAYIVAKDPVSGTLVKLPGSVSLDETTGQITSRFENSPQLAFEDAEIHLFGGERAPLATPSHCGLYTTNATFTPWSGTPPVSSSSSFEIKTGPGGGPCPPAALPFNPSLSGGSTNISAGSFSPLSTTISRQDGDQSVKGVQLHFPNGLSGLLAGVTLCPEAQANAGTCAPQSLIGHTIVSVGLGGDPFSVTGGQVFLTEGYKGAPFGLSIVNPAVAGPFNLGTVVVRAKVEVDPRSAALTVTTDETPPYNIPPILDGIPLQIKHVNVLIDRPGFTFNPTSCEPAQITGQITATEGGSSPVVERFQVTNCAALKFTPKVAVTTAAHTSKADGASLNFKIAYPKGAMGTQSWFNEAKFVIPQQLPARLTTIQKACLAATFETNRAACPAASKIGHAIVHTEVLPVPLEGPVYFVSYGSAKFPDAVVVLDGYGVHIELHGETFIHNGVTSATFRNTPDVPFESIEVTVPTGPFSEFGANLPASARGSFCGQKLTMPTLFKAQSGVEIHQNTAVTVSGCPKAKRTRKQKLAAALKVCRKKHGRKRASCERSARKRYGPVSKAKRSTSHGRGARS